MAKEFSEMLKVTRKGAVATVRLQREDGRNALSAEIMQGLTTIAHKLKSDTKIHAVILSGDPVFSAGADLKDRALTTHKLSQIERRQALLLGPDMCAAWAALEQVTIAAIEGFCIGGGVALSVACDWRVMSSNAYMRLPEIPLGMNMSWQSNPRITALIGPSRAKQLVILGESVFGEEAERWGLIDKSVAPGTAMAEARSLAAKVVALPPVAVRVSKQAINASAHALDYATSFMDREQYALLSGSSDNKEAVSAFLEKRPPKFTGN